MLGVSAVVTYFLSGFLAWFFNWTKTVKWIVTIVVIGLLTILTVTDQIHNLHFDEFPASWFQSVNPLAIILLAPLFTMLWGQLSKKNLEPPSPLKMVMGLALIAVGYVIIAYAVHGVNSSTKIAMFWLIALYVVHTMGELCLSPIGLSLVSKLAPLRLSSLLMGTWFLANAAANKFAGTLSALIPPDTSEVAVEAKMPSIFGIEISDLFVFFCVFIVLSGAGALVLLAIYRKLLKMMHGVR
ncbi:MAG: hypothetical protein IT241_03800 [Bacteroidia bacterium]|nr:hypothetical protein [Bacteroidia bacterium]